jgi:hypothetical protein
MRTVSVLGVIGSAAQVKTLISPIIEGHDHTSYPRAPRCESKVSIRKLGPRSSLLDYITVEVLSI